MTFLTKSILNITYEFFTEGIPNASKIVLIFVCSFDFSWRRGMLIFFYCWIN